ncbi:MAG: pyrimidine reductase [Salinibacterium sp.]|nr:MAG: pyrimidine reductase [Salinibacterium sp.]
MILTRAYPSPAESLDLDAPAARDRLLEWYRADAPLVRLNLVTSVSGSAIGPDGTSASLTAGADRRILGVIRQLSDIVLVGAATVRAEGYVLPKRSPLAILTASGDFSGHQLGDDVSRVIVLCAASAIHRVRETLGDARIIELDAPIAMNSLVQALRGAGFESIVCEGGPNLASQLLRSGLVDELCLTTSPVLTEAGLAALGTEPLGARALTLEKLLLDETGSLFARWRVDVAT